MQLHVPTMEFSSLSTFIVTRLLNRKIYPWGKNFLNIYSIHYCTMKIILLYSFSLSYFNSQIRYIFWRKELKWYFEWTFLEIDICKVTAWMNSCDLTDNNTGFANKQYERKMFHGHLFRTLSNTVFIRVWAARVDKPTLLLTQKGDQG